jgi:hypothetical protein
VKRRRDKLRKLGRGAYTSQAQTARGRARLQAYYESGVSSTRLAATLGCAVATVLRHLKGGDYRMRRQLFDKVMAYDPQPDAFDGKKRGGSLLDNTGTQRRLRALNAEGFGSEFIGARMGVHGRYIADLMRGAGGEHVTYEMKRDVARVYEELAGKDPVALGMTLNNVNALKSGAKRKGWLTSIWWDDDTIDDPGASLYPKRERRGIDEMAVERALGGEPMELTREERGEVQRRLAASLEAVPMDSMGGPNGYSDPRVVKAARGLGVETARVTQSISTYRKRMQDA